MLNNNLAAIKLLKLIIALTFCLSFKGFATPISCASVEPNDITNYVEHSTACMLGSSDNDTQNPMIVNVDAMFGVDEWMLAGKYEGGSSGDFELTGTFDGLNISE